MEFPDVRLDRRSALGLAAVGVGGLILPGSRAAAATPLAGGALGAATLAAPAGAWGDQGDGSYVNQIIPADCADLDAIRVGSNYYAISSTMQYSPGMAVLHSTDLVNWSIIGHAATDLTRIGPELNWDRMNRYGHGIWAGAIRYHAGRYWVYFNTPDEGFFVTSAVNPAGPWDPLTAMWRTAGWNDVCPFWDDNGQGYLATTNFADGYKIYLIPLGPDNKSLVTGSRRLIHQSKGSEASKLYKINGRYYHFYSEVRSGRVVMMNRSTNLFGPYETRQLNRVSDSGDRQPNQGGLVQTPSGAWYFVTHHGTGGHWEGRSMSLLPVTWVDGWPIPGQVGADGIGTMVWGGPMPTGGVQGAPLPAISGVITNDDFSRGTLRPQWEWNYHPRADRWSLTERPGYLRLRAFAPLATNALTRVGNVLTQRSFKSTSNVATVRLELGGMASGQHAGLSHFSATYAGLGVSRSGSTNTLTLNVNGTLTNGPQLTAAAIWLRSSWDINGVSRFSYSLDGRTFTDFGGTYQLSWGGYRGDHVGVYTYNPAGTGYVDVDTFTYTTAPARAYTVTNAASGKVADVTGGSGAPGTAVIQWRGNGGTNQQWQFHPTGDGYHTIGNVRSGLLLDVAGGAVTDGAAVVQTAGIAGNGSRSQQWQLRSVGGGGFVVVNRNSGKVLDVTGSSVADGAALVQWTDRGAANQRWSFRLQG